MPTWNCEWYLASSLHFCCIWIWITMSSKPQSLTYSVSFLSYSLFRHMCTVAHWGLHALLSRDAICICPYTTPFNSTVHLQILKRPHLPQTHTPRVPTVFMSHLTLGISYCINSNRPWQALMQLEAKGKTSNTDPIFI